MSQLSNIVILGARGQLGNALVQRLGARAIPLGREEVDVTDAAAVARRLSDLAPDAVVNCAAYNFVDRAEDEPVVAFEGNSLGPRNLALWCGANQIPLLHVSTDYVFGGASCGRPWTENHAPFPTSVYASTKLAGEYFVRSLCASHYVVRTCGLFGTPAAGAAGKGNFVRAMLRRGAEWGAAGAGVRGEVRVVADQFCTPTGCAELAAAIESLLESGRFGLYHATCAGATTWHRFAEKIFELQGWDVPVRPVSTAEFGAKARRPSDSVLDTAKLADVIGGPLPSWEESLARYLREIA